AGNADKFYIATDSGKWYWDNGTVWVLLALSQTMIVPMINQAGATLAVGDLVVVDQVSSTVAAVASSSTVDDRRIAGVVVIGGPAATQVMIATDGYVGAVNVASAVAKGAFLHQSATVRRAESVGYQSPGAFGFSLTSIAAAGSIPVLIRGCSGGG